MHSEDLCEMISIKYFINFKLFNSRAVGPDTVLTSHECFRYFRSDQPEKPYYLYIWSHVKKKMLYRWATPLSSYLKHTEEMSSNDCVVAVCNNVPFHCVLKVYVGSCCGSEQLQLYNLLLKMFMQDCSVFGAVFC